jgi:ribonuclease P protein component
MTLKHRDFVRLKQDGRAIRTPWFTVILAPGAAPAPRLGITAGKHVGNAYERNRIKRLTREFFRLHRHRLGRNWDINVIIKKEAAGLDSARFFSEFKTVFHQIAERASNGV